MPLMKRKSEKAFKHNIEAEMHSGKPQKQALAIAYSVKRRAKKASGGAVQSGSRDMNMAEGGSISASNEKRPMPDNRYNDEQDIRENDHKRNNGEDGWTDKPTEKQAKANDVRGKKLPIKHPRMVPTDAFSTRLYDREGNLQESAKPGPYGEQPESWEDEEDAKKSGHPVRDMEPEHSTGRKPYAKGGKIEESDRESHNINHPTEMEPDENDMYNNPERDDMPSEDEGAMSAHAKDEEGQDRQGPEVPDMEDEHSTHRKPYAGGGEVEDSEENIDHEDYDMNPAHRRSEDDSEMQPEEEEQEEHHNSIAAAIMARRDRMHREIDSGAYDMDEAVRMAEGGEILSHDSIYSDDSDQADLSRNHDEDANEEDQLSFNALRKESYNSSNLDVENPKDSAQMGDEEEANSENKHDMVSSIRRKMKSRKQF
jgi:hypothetical protein